MTQTLFRILAAAAMLYAMTGCGGSGGSGTSSTGGSTTGGTTAAVQTLAGTVATGAPVVGATITVKDSAGRTATGTTSAGGIFSIPVTGMTPPFMLVASATGQQNMYSILPAMDMTATNTQRVNITPVTTLVMYQLSSGDPAAMFNNGAFTTVSRANVSAAETIVRNMLPANTINPIFSLMYGNFTAGAVPNTDPYDLALDGLGRITSITSANLTLANGFSYAIGGSAAGAPSIALTMTDMTTPFAVRTSVSNTSPALITATVLSSTGTAVANAIVTFSTSDARDTFSGGANTALTNASGVASVTLTTSNTAGGAGTVTANATVNGVAATRSLNYAIGSSSITLSAITVPATTLSAYGTASISVNVMNNGVLYTAPMTVSFTSSCASRGNATLTASVATVNGTATASYLDNGCNNASPGDTITATLMNGVTATASLPVASPAIGSIQFVSVVTNPATTPPMIALRGSGGTSRSESARVTFRVVDSAGNPAGNAQVTFSLNTSLGGLALSSTSATSDPSTGNVVTDVLAGTMSTSVRVTATTPGLTGTMSTQSDQLVVSTGVAAQDAFSLSATTHNIEGLNIDGTSTTLTARLADHFHNPVPDGTAVYFTSEGGSIAPSCTTVSGVCSVRMTSQALRPSNGRVTVLGRATGEEAFIDLNSNGTVDAASEMIDANATASDMGEAYVDFNENGIYDSTTEPFFDFNSDGAYNGTTTGTGGVGGTATGDGKYNGVLCTSGAAICSGTQRSIDVRASQIIVFSGSNAVISINSGNAVTLTPGAAPDNCPGTAVPVVVNVVDSNGNAMPAGTSVAYTTTNGTLASTGFTVPDTIGCNSNYASCPASAGSASFGNDTVSAQSDSYFDSTSGTCINISRSGIFTVRVTTPSGMVTTASVPMND